MTIACSNCNKQFEIKKVDARRANKFCSFTCYQAYRKINHKPPNCICLECKKPFYKKNSALKNGEGKFCSRPCKISNQRLGIDIRGESYKDRNNIRQSSRYKKWRYEAKKLRGNKCQKCGVLDRSVCNCCGTIIYLHVHHVKPFSPFIESRFDPSNSSVLCSKCH